MKRIIFVISLFFVAALSMSALTTAQQADSAYNVEDYRMAIRLYLKAIDDDGVSPEICYNLGNAYYRIDELGRSVLFYQRALALDPSMDDARSNLDFVKTHIIDKPEDDSSFLSNLHRRILSAFSPNAWAWIAFIMFAILIGCVALYIFSSNVSLRKTGFFGALCLLVLTVYAITISYQAATAHSRSNMAVVIVPTANLRSMPGASTDNNKVIPIHEGTVLEITDSLIMSGESSSPKWYDVKINNSTRAWVNAADVEQI
ncbi:MAG: tetratricopeptide repeat protein [Muribaculaceae bacterium]|nr:tetratricopeptide repeat protein [Muribaculaceae bacterium]